MLATRTIQVMAKCDYCGKKIVVQNEDGENVDGNRMVLEIDGSRRRVCRRCSNNLPLNPKGVGFQKIGRD